MDHTTRPRRFVQLGAALAAVLVVLLPGAPAWAHNSLVDAQPAKNAKLTEAPAEVKLSFLQKLNPEFTTIVVSDAAQQKVAADPPKVSNKTATLTFSAPPAGGDYTVAYQVVSTDGHTVKGSYKFSVAGAAPASSATPAPVASAAAPVPQAVSAEQDGGSSWLWLIVIVVVAAGALAAFGVARSRRTAR